MHPRLIDLHTRWLLQYAPETTVFDPAFYPRVPQRLGQAEGYLQTASAAVLSVYRTAEDWASQADPWRALGELITRIEAEFAGRLLMGREDFERWLDEPEGMTWGLIGIEGFDALVRAPDDLDRLSGLFMRGVRLFQPVSTATSVLGGSADPGDDRGLTDLGIAFLEALAGLATAPEGPRPVLDLAHMNTRSAAEALTWFEADADRPRRLIPVHSHGTPAPEGDSPPRAITVDTLRRLRALGGVTGFGISPPFYETPEEIKAGIESAASLPFEGRAGYEGIALGTDFLGLDRTLRGLANAPEVVAWVTSAFPPETAAALLQDNARRLVARAVGAPL